MINVDIFVPAIDRTYNFNLAEDEPITYLIDEITELICKKEHSELAGNKEMFFMGSVDQKISFNSKQALRDYSVKNGETLVLV